MLSLNCIILLQAVPHQKSGYYSVEWFPVRLADRSQVAMEYKGWLCRLLSSVAGLQSSLESPDSAGIQLAHRVLPNCQIPYRRPACRYSELSPSSWLQGLYRYL